VWPGTQYVVGDGSVQTKSIEIYRALLRYRTPLRIARRVKRGTGVAFAYSRHHGDPYVFPTGVVEEQGVLALCLLEDPVVRQPVP
jgi:hypothetical protein